MPRFPAILGSDFLAGGIGDRFCLPVNTTSGIPIGPSVRLHGDLRMVHPPAAMPPVIPLPTPTNTSRFAFRSWISVFLLLLGCQIVPGPRANGAVLSLEGVHVVPHLQSMEMQ